jgi:FMN-dependent oxidoreductase (nitrilotriacetate monooxygenase family)
MTAPRSRFSLGAFIMQTGHHIAGWRHPDAQADAGSNFRHVVQLAQQAEAAKFDAVFVSDSAGVRGRNLDSLSRTARAEQFEPLTLLSALAAVTERIGLIGTASTTFNEPFNIARKFASLDQISGGRAAWNLVTSSGEGESENFNRTEHMEHSLRYERAQEFHQVVTGLWDSWEDDAFIRDKEQGRYFHPEKLHVLHHKGKHFSVRGPLNVARSPQGQPVIVQAGASEAGKDLAARTAEVIFVAHQTFDEAREFYTDIKRRAGDHGRDADDIKIMPGIFPVVARTREEAEEKFQQLQELIPPVVGVALLSQLTSFDLSAYPVDGPLPALPPTNGAKSRQQLLVDLARRDGLSIRQTYLRIAGARGHQQIVGSAKDVADLLEMWFKDGGADGFNIMSPVHPSGLSDFITLVVPELHRRGLFRTEYEGRTLRDHLGLKRPEHRVRSQQRRAPALAWE